MADILTAGTMFPPELVSEMINLVKGKSALARLCAQSPIPFSGIKEFTFTLDKEVDLVAENGAKTKGGATVEPVTIVPVKVEYGARVSDEFVKASDAVRINYLRSFSDGFSRKVARGLDIMAIHGVNPRTNSTASQLADKNFDALLADSAVQHVVTATNDADADVESAIAMVTGEEWDVDGIAMAPAFRSSLASIKVDGKPLYESLRWGNAPADINGLALDVNGTVSFGQSLDKAIVGNFRDAFKWGIADEIAIEVIEYGNPDNDATLGDLKGHNQVYLRGECYLGWGILAPKAFAMIKTAQG